MHYSGPERRDNNTDRQLHELSGRVRGLEESVYVVRTRQAENHEKINEMWEIVTTAKGFFNTLQAAGRVAKPLLWIGALCSAIWMGIKTGAWNFKA